VPFNRPWASDAELTYTREALMSSHRQGDGRFTERCHAWLEQHTRTEKALLTTSCTAALEMAALLIDVGPGDEVIMPSFTFVSTANAFVLRGAVPVFVDIDPMTQNIAPEKIEAAITPRTKAIVPVHYAGIACDMDAIMAIAERHRLFVIEDAAQGLLAYHKGRHLGTIGHLGALSFHDTKNVSCGEGGALLINDRQFIDRALIIREKGTNRQQMLLGLADKYTWVDIGSSFLPSEVTAAFLLAQLEAAHETCEDRRATWYAYHAAFEPLAAERVVQRPAVPPNSRHNGHLYYLLLRDGRARDEFIRQLRACGIGAPFHYVPLHTSPAGRRFCRTHGPMRATIDAGERLVRLPLWRNMPASTVAAVTEQAIWAAQKREFAPEESPRARPEPQPPLAFARPES